MLEGDDVITMAGSQLTFTPGQNVRYQNTCGVSDQRSTDEAAGNQLLYCHLEQDTSGAQRSKCALPKQNVRDPPFYLI